MEVKLVQEFDYNDKNTLFGKMDSMNDAIVKEICEIGNSVLLTLHQFDDIQGPDGEIIWPYKELEIEYVYADKKDMEFYYDFDFLGKWNKSYRISSMTELTDLMKQEKIGLEMYSWSMTAGGSLILVFCRTTMYHDITQKPIKSKSKIYGLDIDLGGPQKIIYRWKA